MSALVPIDRTRDLNNMPSFEMIEDIVVLREAAQKRIEELESSGEPDAEDRIREIEMALAELKKAHHTADHHDAGKQCPERPMIRKGRIV